MPYIVVGYTQGESIWGKANMSVGKSVRLFLVDGTPGGLITAEIMNWTGHVIAASRSDLGALLKRPELSRTGIYILLGEDPQNALEPMAYIGEADIIKDRLYQHARPENQHGKDFWNRAIALTSKDQTLPRHMHDTWKAASSRWRQLRNDHASPMGQILTSPSFLKLTFPIWTTLSPKPRSCCHCLA
jgi:hypothetical protein